MKDSKNAILDFWFQETKPAQWFQANPDFDALILARFGADLDMASAGIFDGWRDDADGCLALCLVFDQFPRNMFRGQARAFATDTKGLDVARHAVAKRFDVLMAPERRRFLYLPYEHTEALDVQEEAVRLFAGMKKDDPLGYDYAIRHRDVIARFGRFPHRNAALGRVSTPEEEAYLAEAGSGF